MLGTAPEGRRTLPRTSSVLLDLAALAGAFKIGPESALNCPGKLVREGKATITRIQATGR